MNNWKSVAAVLLGLLFLVTICAAEDDQFTPNSTPASVNQTLHSMRSDNLTNFSGTTEPVITLVLLQSNNTKMPGPRDMAFGPTSISIKTTPSSLIVISLLAVAALAGLILFRRRW
ncbi:hypothetical protein [Methanosphaerula palustris]|uniref:Uncharacterized protein n=1 Tax=Methanosphaerula palustris (strain ATCC BAA-1556 / DSM 19958 / E1-9c) TaxID=521011 RepID=B8GHH3_METPE|nr:hypothetical protein [Methanosphaerula palustris]ACL16578.1 hypothetical protein Mpal_1243 [Methanosphaerula palustris E1-9c]